MPRQGMRRGVLGTLEVMEPKRAEQVDIKEVGISRGAVVVRAADVKEITLRHPGVRIPKDGAVQIAMRERTDPRDQDGRILI
jgi:hypothetical protein